MKSREELASHATGIAAELGVADGYFSEVILLSSNVSVLYSIDRWSDHHDEEEMKRTERKLAQYWDRSRIVRASFADVVSMFADDSFSFIYIDGYAHEGQDEGKTLVDWWPKLKRGGLFAGHDYCPTYQPTMQAVDGFCTGIGIKPEVTEEDSLPSWFIFKP